MGRFTTIRQLEPPAWELELALRWLRGEVNLAGIAKARGNFNASNSLAWVGPRLKAAFAAGKLTINKDRPRLNDLGEMPAAQKQREALEQWHDEFVEADFRRAEALDKLPEE